MFSFVQRFRQLFQPSRSPSPRPRQPKRLRLEVEGLEDRLVPTVAFWANNPLQAIDAGGMKLNDVPIYLIFYGSYWQAPPPGDPTTSTIATAVKSMVEGPYLKGLSQYGVTGNASLNLQSVYLDTTDPQNLNFNADTMRQEIEKFQDANIFPESDDLPTLPIYCVITPPEITPADGVGLVGYNTLRFDDNYIGGDYIPLVWAGEFKASPFPGAATKLDNYVCTLSHEIAESISCTGNDGIVIQYSPLTEDQISDGEAQNYTYRVNGNLVQSYWSGQGVPFAFTDGSGLPAFVVPDGNTQTLWVDNGVLTINGDQLSGNFADTITLGTAGGGVSVVMNGESFQFDPKQISSIVVNPGSGTNAVNVESTLSGVSVTINEGSGFNVVNISPTAHNLNNIQGSVNVSGNSTLTFLKVYDQAAAAGTSYNIEAASVAREGAATINESGVTSLTLNASSGGNNQINISPAKKIVCSFPTTLTVNGGGGDTLIVNDQADSASATYNIDAAVINIPGAGTQYGPLSIWYSGVSNVGLNAGTSKNLIYVSPTGKNLDGMPSLTLNGGGGSYLTVSDQNNSAGSLLGWSTSYTVTGQSLTRTETMLSLSGGSSSNKVINYSHLTGLTLNASNSPNAVNVESTPASTNVYEGLAASTIYVCPTSKNLDGIGSLTVDGGKGGAALVVYDQNNPNLLYTNYIVTSTSLSRLGFTILGNGYQTVFAASLSCTHLTGLTLNTGNTTNFVNVESTPATTTVTGGAGYNAFAVCPTTKNLDGIGTLTLDGGKGGGTLTVNDQNNSAGSLLGWSTSYAVTGQSLTRTVSMFSLSGSSTRNSVVNCSHLTGLLTLNASNSPNAVNVQSTLANVPVTVNGGTGTNNQFTVGFNGSVKNIHSLVSVNGFFANTKDNSLVVDDSKATTLDQVTVSGTQVSGTFFGTGGLLSYSSMDSLTVNLSNAYNDMATVSPGSFTTITINGSAAAFQAGHKALLSLTQVGQKHTTTTSSGYWTFTGGLRQVNYTNCA